MASPQKPADKQPILKGSDFSENVVFSAFAFEIQKNIVQVLFDVSGNTPSGKSAEGEIVAHFVKFFPMVFLQFLAGNQFFQFSFRA